MSAQGGTLQRRGTIEVPIWPVAVLVIVAIATAIGMTLVRDTGPTRFVTSVTETERLENSTAAVREQGAVAPAIDLTNSGVGIRIRGFATPVWGSSGGPNEALHRQYSPPREDAAATPRWGPMMVNGEPCMQCR